MLPLFSNFSRFLPIDEYSLIIPNESVKSIHLATLLESSLKLTKNSY